MRAETHSVASIMALISRAEELGRNYERAKRRDEDDARAAYTAALNRLTTALEDVFAALHLATDARQKAERDAAAADALRVLAEEAGERWRAQADALSLRLGGEG